MLQVLRISAWTGLIAVMLGMVHDAIPHVHGAPAAHDCAETGIWDAVLHLADAHSQGIPCDDHHDRSLKQWSSERPASDVDTALDEIVCDHVAGAEQGQFRCARTACWVDSDVPLHRSDRHPCRRRGPPCAG
jgi:hypothetical protein